MDNIIEWDTQRFVDAAATDEERAAARRALEADRSDVHDAVAAIVMQKFGIKWPKHPPFDGGPFTEAELRDCAARAFVAPEEVLAAIAGGAMPPAKHQRIVEQLGTIWAAAHAPEPHLPPPLTDHSSTGPSKADFAAAGGDSNAAWSAYHERRRGELEAEHRRVYAHLHRAHDEWAARRQAREAALRREGKL